jgi:hypothetical protein
MRLLRALIALALTAASARAWQRARCGPGDQVTRWGLTVDPAAAAPLPEHPRPQLVREGAGAAWASLNGLWQWEPSAAGAPLPFGRDLTREILVPFPMESCLSGINETHAYSFYRLVFDAAVLPGVGGAVTLRFGAVDWQARVFLNRVSVANHTGGYSRFSADVTALLLPAGSRSNELIVAVFDPTDSGPQPMGKQRVSAMAAPYGDHYTPSSGIWQTVWLERSPLARIERLQTHADDRALFISAELAGAPPDAAVDYVVFDEFGAPIARASAPANATTEIAIPAPVRLWAPGAPQLDNFTATLSGGGVGDSVLAYFGLRALSLLPTMQPPLPAAGPQSNLSRTGYLATAPGAGTTAEACATACDEAGDACAQWQFSRGGCARTGPESLCYLVDAFTRTKHDPCATSGAKAWPGGPGLRPAINGEAVFLAGWLDQSWWPDGQYSAPTDEALAFDLEAVIAFGYNAVRLHQKVNSDRWYWHADRLGVAVEHDAVQHFGPNQTETVDLFFADLHDMIRDVGNSPAIVQWEIFNEADCQYAFDAAEAVALVRQWDPHRWVNVNSGGPYTQLGLADVNDYHSYPYPQVALGSATQYAMLGEYGGVGAFVQGKEWAPGLCYTYLPVAQPHDEAEAYVNMTQQLVALQPFLGGAFYTQITDVESECDGFLNYDRSAKFSDEDMAAVVAANKAMIAAYGQ